MTDPTWLDRRLYPFRSRTVDADGHRFHYVDEGQGPLLLFVHPSPVWSFVYRNVIRALRGRYRCVAVDLPGFGLSTPATTFGFGARDHSRALRAFIGATDLNDVTVMLHSMSCSIGLHALGEIPDRVRALIVSNGFAWRLDQYPDVRRMLAIVGSPAFAAIDRRFNLMVRFVDLQGTKRRLTAEERAAYAGPFATSAARRATTDVLRSLRETAFQVEVEEALARFRSRPALILFSDGDVARAPDWMERYERAFDTSTKVVIPDAGHFLQEDAPERVAQAIDGWRSALVSAPA